MSVSSLSIAWAALRRRPFSFIVTIVLCSTSAVLIGVAVPVALTAWLLSGLVALAIWLVVEPIALERLGCRKASPSEQVRLAASMLCSPASVLIVDDSAAWVGAGLRTLVISSAVLDIVDEQPLIGLLAHAKLRMDAACFAREGLVWLGNLPLLGVCLLTRALCQVGTVLAFAVGASLSLPLLLWPTGFVTWVGRLFGWTLVALLGAMFLSGGLAALGLGMLLGWALVAGLRALLDWESRRSEVDADRATVQAGHGPQLLEALETFAWLNPPQPDGWHRVLIRAGAPLNRRIERLSHALSQP
jgi:hypothetical protein